MPSDLLQDPGFRPKLRLSRAWAVAVLLNALLFGGLVAVPWARGRYRAVDAQSRFAAYAACLWGGRPTSSPGLGLPEGEREQYATRVLHAPDDWPQRCREPLSAIAPEEATLLFPGIKDAEEQVREAVRVTDAELVAMAELRRGAIGRVPERPLLATGRLLATLSVWATETGEAIDAHAHAIEFVDPARLVEPTRVPLTAAIGSPTRIEARADGVAAVAVDARGLSWVRAFGGRVDLQRVRRPTLLRALVGTPSAPLGLWATDERRCAERADRCAGRSAGVGRPFDADDPQPRWIAGHPASDPHASVWVGDDHLWLVARGSGATPQARRFARHPHVPASSAAPTAPDRVIALPDDARIALVGSEPIAVMVATSEGEPQLLAHRLDASGAQALHPVAPASELQTCSVPARSWVLAATRDGRAVVAHVDGTAAAAHRASLPRVADGADPRLARRLACDGEVLDVITTHAGIARWTRCTSGPRCDDRGEVARGVAHADLARDSGATLVALSGAPDAALVRVGRLPEREGQRPSLQTPAPCWDPDAGFCGPPMVSARNGRFVVAVREGIDLRAIESTDAGRSFRPMTGVR